MLPHPATCTRSSPQLQLQARTHQSALVCCPTPGLQTPGSEEWQAAVSQLAHAIDMLEQLAESEGEGQHSSRGVRGGAPAVAAAAC